MFYKIVIAICYSVRSYMNIICNKNIKKYLRDKIIPYSFYLKMLNKLLSI